MDFSWGDILWYASYTLVGCAYGGYLLSKKAKESRGQAGAPNPEAGTPPPPALADEDGDAHEQKTGTPEEMPFILAMTGFEDELQELLDSGVDIDTRDGAGQTPLMRVAHVRTPLNAYEDGSPDRLMNEVDHLFELRGDDRDETWQELDNTCLRMLKFLLAHGADANARDPQGRTPLMHAATYHPIGFDETPHPGPQFIEALVKAGADVNAVDNEGMTALLHAAEDGQPTTVDALLAAGADISARAKDGQDFSSCIVGNFSFKGEPLEKLLAAGKVDVHARDAAGRTPLMHLDKWWQTRSAEQLIRYGADLRAKDNEGLTAYGHVCKAEIPALLVPFISAGEPIPEGVDAVPMLMGAAELDDLAALRRLLERFKPAAGGKALNKALRTAALAGHGEAVEILLAAGANPNAPDDDEDEGKGDFLHETLVRTQDLRTIRALIAAGAGMEHRDCVYECNACLTAAAAAGTPEIIRLLEEAGLDVAGTIPKMLDAAGCDGNVETVRYLLESPRYKDAEIGDGMEKALGSAVYNGKQPLVEYLLQRGAKVTQHVLECAANGHDPAMLRYLLDHGYKGDFDQLLLSAAEEVKVDQVKVLLAAGASVTKRDKDGNTALLTVLGTFDSPIFDKEEIVRSLLAAGADPNARNHAGDTPITLCLVWNGFWGRRIIPMLLKAGATIPATDSEGKTIPQLLQEIDYSAPIYKALGK